MYEKISSGDALVKILEMEGVEYLFGVPGSHILPFYDSLTRSTKIKTILTKHEEGAAFMAKCYARASGRPGVCCGTAGPGATNLVTGVADAYVDNIPMIVITGQVATSVFGRNANQEATGEFQRPDQVGLFSSITKQSSLVFDPELVMVKVREAFRLALSEPYGPVHLCFPSDVLGRDVSYTEMSPSQYRITSWNQVDPIAVEAATGLIEKAERPVILAGHRAAFPDSSQEVKDLAEHFRIPVATTIVAKGILPEDHSLSLGCIDLFGHRVSEKYIHSADLLITIGEYFDEYSTIYYDPGLISGKRLVQIDNHPYQIGKIYPVDVGVVGNIKASLKALINSLSNREYTSPSKIGEIKELKSKMRHFDEPEMHKTVSPLKPQRIMRELREAIPEDSLVLCDISSCLFWAVRYFEIPGPDRFFCSWGIKPVGFGAGGAAGLKLARPDKHVFAFCGDGGMQMNGMEVMTAVNYEIPVTWVIFNDEGLYMVRIAQGLSYGERYIATKMRNPDFTAMAESFGADGYKIENSGQISEVISLVLEKQRPAVIDICYDGDEILPIKPRAVKKVKEMGLDVSDSPFASRAFRKILDER